LDAEKWYSVNYKELMGAGGSGVLFYHKGSHTRALTELFPELTFKKWNFSERQPRPVFENE